MIKTVSERREETRSRLRTAVERLSHDLVSYSASSGGDFYLFGSFVHGDFSDVSDVDIMVDFPEALRAEAMDVAETACLRHELKADVRPSQWVSPGFAARVKREGRKL